MRTVYEQSMRSFGLFFFKRPREICFCVTLFTRTANKKQTAQRRPRPVCGGSSSEAPKAALNKLKNNKKFGQNFERHSKAPNLAAWFQGALDAGRFKHSASRRRQTTNEETNQALVNKARSQTESREDSNARLWLPTTRR